jgi:hypothetical protein
LVTGAPNYTCEMLDWQPAHADGIRSPATRWRASGNSTERLTRKTDCQSDG